MNLISLCNLIKCFVVYTLPMKKYFWVILHISIVCLFQYVLTAINIHLFIYFYLFTFSHPLSLEIEVDINLMLPGDVLFLKPPGLELKFGFVCICYSSFSHFNLVLYIACPQRVSLPIKKMLLSVLRGQCCPSIWVWQPAADSTYLLCGAPFLKILTLWVGCGSLLLTIMAVGRT
jgi:hypothetical protein